MDIQANLPFSWTLARSLIWIFSSSNNSVETFRISAQSCNRSSFEVCVDVTVKLIKNRTYNNCSRTCDQDDFFSTESRIFPSTMLEHNVNCLDDLIVSVDVLSNRFHLWFEKLPFLKTKQKKSLFLISLYSLENNSFLPKCLVAGISNRLSARTNASNFCANLTPYFKGNNKISFRLFENVLYNKNLSYMLL